MKKLMFLAVSAVLFGAFGAGELEDADLVGDTDKRAIDYKPGEEMTFTLKLRNAKLPLPEGEYRLYWKRQGDDGKVESGTVPLSADPFVYKTKLEKPGFVRLTAQVILKNGNPFKKSFKGDPNTPEGKKALNAFERADRRVFFDGGAGVEPEKLQSVPEPADFDAFWASRKARLAKVPMTPVQLEERSSPNSPARTYKFSVPCAGPRPVTGQLTIPRKPGKYPATISFHGYGARFIQQVPSWGSGDRITMFINAHGYELDREPEYYEEFYKSIMSNGKSFGLDKVRNSDTNAAYFGGMTYRIMRALQFLKSQPEWDGKNLTATGGSMGGLQTMWAASLDPDVSEAKPSIPWCCDIGGRDTLGRLADPWRVEETEALRYFDPVNLCKRIPKTCRVEVTRAGLGDYCCPPSGIFVLWNNMTCPKKINWVQGSTHGYVPPQPNATITLTENWD